MHKLKLYLIIIAGISFYCYEFFLRILTGAYQEEIIKYLNIKTHVGFSFLVSSYNITYFLMQIPAGILLDRFGSKKVLVFAILLCGIGNVIFINTNYTVALFGRLLVGLGSSFAFIGVLKLTLENFKIKHFPIITSFVISLGTLSAAFTQNISVIISSYKTSWINIFIYSGAISIPLAILFYIIIPNKKHSSNFMPKFNEIIKNVKQLIKNNLIWKNAIWSGLIYIPTVVLTSQYGVLFFNQAYGFDSIYSTILITTIFIGWIIFSPIITSLCNKFNGKNIITISIIGLLLVLITINTQSLKNYAISLAFLFGTFSASQVLVWHYFSKICNNLNAVGITITNMLITLIIEVGQLSVGVAIDIGDYLKVSANNMIFLAFVIILFLALISLNSMIKIKYYSLHDKKF